MDLAKIKKQPSLKALETEFLKMPQVECEITHNFADGIYARERFAKADTLIIGHRHRKETLSILLKGEMSVYMDEGGPVKRIVAPCIWTTGAGAKRMTYSHTDTILVTVHPTKEADLEKIEQECVIPEEEYLIEQSALKALIKEA